jgi:hypothetical protein
VPRPDFPRSVVEFQDRFGDEEACRRYLHASRWPNGFSCPRCGCGAAGEQSTRRLWECRACHHQTSVTAGTVMQATRTPLQLWFWAAYLVATHHPGIALSIFGLRVLAKQRNAAAESIRMRIGTYDSRATAPGSII